MQAFDGEILCMLMYANVSVKTRLNTRLRYKNGHYPNLTSDNSSSLIRYIVT